MINIKKLRETVSKVDTTRGASIDWESLEYLVKNVAPMLDEIESLRAELNECASKDFVENLLNIIDKKNEQLKRHYKALTACSQQRNAYYKLCKSTTKKELILANKKVKDILEDLK